jgi:hypothetical protein
MLSCATDHEVKRRVNEREKWGERSVGEEKEREKMNVK